MTAPWVTACIPTFRCTDYLRSAVLSLLAQTYPLIRVVVINDGDPVSPWPSLANISDRRLIRFDLHQNRGPYFALATALEATTDDFFLVQDADDWSDPRRVATLLSLALHHRSGFAFSAIAQFHVERGRKLRFDRPLCAAPPDTTPGPEFKARLYHHGLFRTHSLRRLGGYFGGFRINYDMLLTNFLLLTEHVSWTAQPLYWRRLRNGSLTRDPNTGMDSPLRQRVRSEMEDLYRLSYADYQWFRMGALSKDQVCERIRSRIAMCSGSANYRAIRSHAQRLRQGLVIQTGRRTYEDTPV